MLPEYGFFSLIYAFFSSVLLALLPSIGCYTGQQSLQYTAKPLLFGQMSAVSIALFILFFSFLQDDFTLSYVANNSNSLLPWYYKISALWGAHEGSLLLWLFFLNAWTVMFALRAPKQIPYYVYLGTLICLGSLSAVFSAFILFTSNPFYTTLPFVPSEGADLNPALQDIGLILHPPILYLGYVGLSVSFALIFSLLWNNATQTLWIDWIKPWVYSTWIFLTLGIILGSWWAYYELGWGGWWFWDPVENVSLMPWLVGSALIHTMLLQKDNRAAQAWSVMLIICAFLLSLMGIFLVRSGLLTSVHSFTADPDRGIFLFSILLFYTVFSVLCYLIKMPQYQMTPHRLHSRASYLLLNSCLLLVMLFTLFIGTLYPIFLDVFDIEQISVGAPYFNMLILPIGVILLFVLPLALQVSEQQSKIWITMKRLLPTFFCAGLLTYVLIVQFGTMPSILSAVCLLASFWVILSTLLQAIQRCIKKNIPSKALFNYIGQLFAHLGLAITALGITLVSEYAVQHQVRLHEGERAVFAGYSFLYQGHRVERSGNYIASIADMTVEEHSVELARLSPERRRYFIRDITSTEAAILPGLLRDIYITMGSPLSDDSFVFHIQIKPMMRLVWLGGILMIFGMLSALIAYFQKRFVPCMLQ